MRFLTLLFGFWLLAWPTFAQDDVIGQVYRNLSKDYINEISAQTITLKGLKALEQMDTDIKLSATDDKLYLYRQRKVIQTFAFPDSNAPTDAWVRFCYEVIQTAIEHSDKVELLDFEIPDRFAEAVFKDLDGYSHYYGAFNRKGGKNIVRRPYAVRMIDDIMMIKILNFHQGVSQKVASAVEDCSACRGIILDLRGNHGGILDEAVKITDLFLDEGIIAYTAQKDGTAPKYYMATTGDIARRKPMVILIDGLSASASEVLAAALSEQNRAILIGTRSYGKGTIQDVFQLGNQRAMALTSAYFYTPSGHKIDKNGLTPAVCTGGSEDVFKADEADCSPEDRFNREVDVETAVKYIKNEL